MKWRKELGLWQYSGMAGGCEQASDIPMLVVRSAHSLAHSLVRPCTIIIATR